MHANGRKTAVMRRLIGYTPVSTEEQGIDPHLGCAAPCRGLVSEGHRRGEDADRAARLQGDEQADSAGGQPSPPLRRTAPCSRSPLSLRPCASARRVGEARSPLPCSLRPFTGTPRDELRRGGKIDNDGFLRAAEQADCYVRPLRQPARGCDS